jgi:hypothetical protein
MLVRAIFIEGIGRYERIFSIVPPIAEVLDAEHQRHEILDYTNGPLMALIEDQAALG